MSTFRSEQIEQPVNLSGSFTGSLVGTASYATFSETSNTSSLVTTSSFNSFTSSYYIDSASFDYRIENILLPTGSGSSENPPITVNVATTTVLPRSPIYNNGSSGIGAFLSASISGTLGNIDGVTLTTEDHLLVKNQANPIQNGVYDVVSTGSASGYYLLSRSLSSDETSELDSQIVIPSFGTTNKGGIFAQTTNNPVIGTDNIVYSQQTNTLINQASAGTQAVYQIPWYVSTARQLSKGSPNFKYINVTSGNTVTTSSLLLTGSFRISGSLNVTNGITGSLLGTASYASTALSSSFATTASYVQNAQTASYVLNAVSASYVLQAVSSSFATTASFARNGNGSFSGSFSGSGANLFGIPSTAIVGLNLSQIATGSVTASVTPTQFSVISGSSIELVVTGTGVTIGNAITDIHRVTGSLNVSGSITVNGIGVSLIKARRQDFVYPFSYCGTAPSGSADASTVWTIVRINISGSTDTTGTASNVAWTDRYSAVYV